MAVNDGRRPGGPQGAAPDALRPVQDPRQRRLRKSPRLRAGVLLTRGRVISCCFDLRLRPPVKEVGRYDRKAFPYGIRREVLLEVGEVGVDEATDSLESGPSGRGGNPAFLACDRCDSNYLFRPP